MVKDVACWWIFLPGVPRTPRVCLLQCSLTSIKVAQNSRRIEVLGLLAYFQRTWMSATRTHARLRIQTKCAQMW